MSKEIPLIILGVVIVGIAIAVGLSLFEEQAKQEKAKQEQTQPAIKTPVQEVVKGGIVQQRIFNRFDFNALPAGTIEAYAPKDDYINNLSEADAKKLDIYIQIKTNDGTLKSVKVDYQVWLQLKIGDVLK